MGVKNTSPQPQNERVKTSFIICKVKVLLSWFKLVINCFQPDLKRQRHEIFVHLLTIRTKPKLTTTVNSINSFCKSLLFAEPVEHYIRNSFDPINIKKYLCESRKKMKISRKVAFFKCQSQEECYGARAVNK